MPNDELFHHGIDGQKWGVRHGPPYPLDREDHNEVVEKSHDATKKRHLSYERSGKYAKRMTDKDLNDTIDRLQREETYRKLVSKEREEKKAAKLAKEAKKEADERYKNQNELSKRQQDLSEQQFKQNKKANSITRKVIQELLLKSIGVASKAGEIYGYKLSEYAANERIKKMDEEKNKNKKGNTDANTTTGNTTNSTADAIKSQLDALYRRQSELETGSTLPSTMKFAGGDWKDDEDTVNKSLIALWPTQ